MKKLYSIALILMLSALSAVAQNISINTNVVAAIDGAANLGVGYALNDTKSIHLSTSIRQWGESEDSVNKYWSTQSEFRWWTCQKFNGSFFGIYTQGGQYKVGGKSYPFGIASDVEEHCFDGWLAGGGVSYGYSWMLGRSWNIEASVGLGYNYLKYTEYETPIKSSEIIGDGDHHYFGANKCSINIVYLF
ncbi:MAG: DUF3575 domain-containing protein [Rikenellaceae bacterium]